MDNSSYPCSSYYSETPDPTSVVTSSSSTLSISPTASPFTSCARGSTIVTSSASTTISIAPTVSPSLTATVMAGGEDGGSVLSASLAIAIISILFCVFLTVIVLIMFYFLLKMNSKIRRLQFAAEGGRGGGEEEKKAGNDSSNLVAINILSDPLPDTDSLEDDKQPPNTSPPPHPLTTTTISSHSPPPPHPTMLETAIVQTIPTRTTLDQTIPEADQTSPVALRDGYDNVQLLSGVIPSELRTAENLEGREMDVAEVRQLEEVERRQEQRYEEVEMNLRKKQEAVVAMRKMADSSRKNEGTGDDDLYTNPADAIVDEDDLKMEAKTGSLKKKKKTTKKRGGEEKKEREVSPPEHEPSLYTTVFDHLPAGEKEVVARQNKMAAGAGGGGGSPSSSPGVEKRHLEVARGGGRGGGGGRRDFCGYEDLENEMFARSAPCNESPLHGDFQLNPMMKEEEENGKTELTKRFSHPTQSFRRDRDSTKEVVEINPRSKKPVTLSSSRKKKHVLGDTESGSGGEGGTKEEVDGGGGEEGERGSKSAGSSPNTKNKQFTIAEVGDIPQQEYAMVDMTGKTRYRAESDSMKREGSGAPKHYTVKECPPDSNTDPIEIVTMET